MRNKNKMEIGVWIKIPHIPNAPHYARLVFDYPIMLEERGIILVRYFSVGLSLRLDVGRVKIMSESFILSALWSSVMYPPSLQMSATSRGGEQLGQDRQWIKLGDVRPSPFFAALKNVKTYLFSVDALDKRVTNLIDQVLEYEYK